MITECRLCNGPTEEVLDLGVMAFTGIFPKPGEIIPEGRLALALCRGECGLVQMADRFDLNLLYGSTYGYRSGLNKGMVKHLHEISERIVKLAKLVPGDTCLDIGSSDATFLLSLPSNVLRIGIDPSAAKFSKFYPSDINLMVDFFPSLSLNKLLENRKVKLVTSIAMFYDLESPLNFAENIKNILDDDGIWYSEQSYLPAMLSQNAYDTICHEHLEYYSAKQMAYIASKVGLKIIHLAETSTNGGSFEVIFAHRNSSYSEIDIDLILNKENDFRLESIGTYIEFKSRIDLEKDILLNTLKNLPDRPWGFGASTKGNVLLQYCGIGIDQLEAIFDINPDKEGCVTPGTNIPITTKQPVGKTYLVLPWHFKEGILINHPNEKFIFPLPKVEVCSG